MRYVMKPTFAPEDIESLGATSVEDAWAMLARDMRDDLPETWTYEDLKYDSHEQQPNGDYWVYFTTPDEDLDWFEEAYQGYNLERAEQ